MNSLITENLLIKSPIIYCLLPTTNCCVLEFPASHYLGPTTQYLLPSTYYLLSTAYCLIPDVVFLSLLVFLLYKEKGTLSWSSLHQRSHVEDTYPHQPLSRNHQEQNLETQPLPPSLGDLNSRLFIEIRYSECAPMYGKCLHYSNRLSTSSYDVTDNWQKLK